MYNGLVLDRFQNYCGTCLVPTAPALAPMPMLHVPIHFEIGPEWSLFLLHRADRPSTAT